DAELRELLAHETACRYLRLAHPRDAERDGDVHLRLPARGDHDPQRPPAQARRDGRVRREQRPVRAGRVRCAGRVRRALVDVAVASGAAPPEARISRSPLIVCTVTFVAAAPIMTCLSRRPVTLTSPSSSLSRSPLMLLNRMSYEPPVSRRSTSPLIVFSR